MSIERKRPASLRASINAKCRECIYDPLAGGTWRQQVEACTCTRCPLFVCRPISAPRATKVTTAERPGESHG